MRLKIVLQPHLTTVLPADYQIQLASYLGVLFNNTEGLFMQRLHQNGYLTPAETVFDAFTFSPILNEEDKFAFILSLCVDDSFEHVVKSILYEQNIDLIAPNNQTISLLIWTISRLPDPNWDKDDLITLRFRCVSPLYLHKNNNSAAIVQPNQRGFKTKFFGNLVDRFLALRHLLSNTPQNDTPPEPPPTTYVPSFVEQMPTAMPQWQSTEPVRQSISKKQNWLQRVLPSNVVYAFKLLTEPKTTLQPSTNDKTAEPTPMLYQYDFELTAPTQLLRIGYEAGFGENTSMGFGFVEMIDQQTLTNC